MKNQIIQIETPDYNALVAQLRERQLQLAVAGRYKESYEVAHRIKRVQKARRQGSRRLCAV